jgi:YD repeat-containing protein
MGRVHQEVSPDTGTATYQYDPEGNRISKTDARGITVLYSYDALNRLTVVDFPNDTDITYMYDNPCPNGKGRLCQVVDQSGTTTYAYSVKGELLQEDKLILGVNYTTGYQYDDNGNLEVLTYPSGRTVRYVYDDADQPTDVLTTPPGGAEQSVASSISYYPFGPSASMTHGNGLVRTAGYDLQYRVTNIQTGSVQDLTYIPDPNGNLQDIINNLDSNKNKSFSYDSLNRLNGATGPWGNLSWSYDNVGNRLSYTELVTI